MLLIGFHAREIGVLAFCHRPAQAHVEQVDVAADRVEWRAQLVAHRAEERCLRLVRRLGACWSTSARSYTCALSRASAPRAAMSSARWTSSGLCGRPVCALTNVMAPSSLFRATSGTVRRDPIPS